MHAWYVLEMPMYTHYTSPYMNSLSMLILVHLFCIIICSCNIKRSQL
jgi:hypothetical protein